MTSTVVGPRRTPESLSALDASFLYLERPTEPMHVGALAVLASVPPVEALLAILRERLGRLPRYRQCPVRAPLDVRLPVWCDDPDFDVLRQVRRATVGPSGDEAALQALVDRIFVEPLMSDRPRWECWLIDGLADGRAALLLKVHHCMIDGVSGVQVLELLTDGVGTDGAVQAVNARPVTDEAPASSWLAAALDAVTHPSRLLTRAREAVAAGSALANFTLRPGDAFPWNGPLGATRAVRWQRFDLDRLFAMRAASGCKINDVALAVIAGGLRAVLPAEVTAGRRARALVPVNVRTAADHLTLGNRISGRFASLPLDVADPRERLRLVAEDMRGQKASGALQAFDVALAIANTLPSAVGPHLARLNDPWPVVHTVCTNVPGPSEPRRLAGVSVEAVHPIVPLAVGIGLGFAMLSYAGSFSITVTADPALVPAIDRLPAALAQAAEELAASLGLPPLAAAAGPAPRALTVGDLMSHPVVTVASNAPLGAAWSQMRAHRIRHLPVVDGAGVLRGLITHRDLLGVLPSTLGTKAGAATSMLAFGWAEVRDVMETHVSTTTAEESAAVAGQRLSRQKIGCLPVVGRRGELVGIVTEQDFLRWAVEHMAA